MWTLFSRSRVQAPKDNGSYYELRRVLERKNTENQAKALIAKGSEVNSPHGRPCNTILHLAIMNGNYELVKMVLDKGGLINMKNTHGKTPLHIAVELGRRDIVELLIARNADVNTTAKDSSMPIRKAIFTRQFKISEILIRNGAKVNVKLNNGHTLFFTAVQTGSTALVEFLLKHAAINRGDNKNCLQLAIKSNNLEMERLLFQHNFGIEYESLNDIKFRHILVAKGYLRSIIKNDQGLLSTAANKKQINIVALLLDHGADINERDMYGKTPLYFSVLEQFSPSQNVQSSYAGLSSGTEVLLVKLLLRRGAHVDTKTITGDTALHEAVKNNNEGVVNTLLEFNAVVNVSNSKGITPLHLAVEKKNLTIVNHLLSRNADVRAVNDNGSTALHFAAETGELNIIKSLLKCNPDVNAVDKFSSTPLHYAARNGHSKCVSILLDHNANVNAADITGSTPLHIAVVSKHIEIIKVLLKSNANTELANENGDTCLHISVKHDLNITKLLLNYCTCINSVNKNGLTPLLIAATTNSRDIIEYLIDYGADVNYTDPRGKNALHLSVYHSRLENVRTLLEKHADVNCKNAEGSTPLLIAIRNRNAEIINILLQYNADVNYTDNKNKSPLHIAIETNNADIISNLLSYGADVNLINDEGLTALLILVNSYYYYNTNELNVLLKFGADTEIKTREGKTALFIATEKRRIDCVKILLSYGADMSILHENKVALLHVYQFSPIHRTECSQCGCEECDGDCDDYYDDWYGSYGHRNRYDDDYGREDEYEQFSSHMSTCKSIVKAYKYQIQKMIAIHQDVDRNTLKAVKYFKNLEAREEDDSNYDECYDIDLEDYDSESDSDDESDYGDNDEDSVINREVKAMKDEKIGSSNITFYNLLTSNVHRVSRYVKNKDVVDVIKSGDYEMIFPTYAGMINARFYRGLEREKLLEKCDYFHHFVLLPFSCIDEIFALLSNQDLRMMIDAYKSESIAGKRKYNLIS